MEIKKKEPVRGEKPVETEELGEKKRIMPKASKIEAKRQQLNRILSEQSKSLPLFNKHRKICNKHEI